MTKKDTITRRLKKYKGRGVTGRIPLVYSREKRKVVIYKSIFV